MRRVEFTVIGLPAPQGSKRAITHRSTGRAVVIESSKRVKPWRDDVARAAEAAMNGAALITGAVRLDVTFLFLRPRSHFRTNGELSARAPQFKSGVPDLSKLVRSTEDALTARVWADDAQVIDCRSRKLYAQQSGAHVIIEEVDADD